MSKRFGRNQKRAMREQLARSNALAEHHRIQSERFLAQGKRNREIIERVREVLGKWFVAFEGDEVIGVRELMNKFSYQQINMPLLNQYRNEPVFPIEHIIHEIDVHRALPQVRELLDTIAIRFESIDGQEIGYSISKNALLMGNPKSIASMVTKEIYLYIEKAILDFQQKGHF